MSKPRRPEWGYIKNRIRAYPAQCDCGGALPRLHDVARQAVGEAIEQTRARKDGEDRLKVIAAVFWEAPSRDRRDLERAAQRVPCSYGTARRWHWDFITLVCDIFMQKIDEMGEKLSSNGQE